ncbi:MAG: FG-GAP repeat protein [Phycisphaerales bacterium]|nr:FG-GAP repeat protein [Phycisphaerales bacterium]
MNSEAIGKERSTRVPIFIQSILIAASSVLWTSAALAQSLSCPPEQLQQLTAPSCDGFQTFGRRLTVLDHRMAEGHFESGGGQVRTYLLEGPRHWEFEAVLRPGDLTAFDAFGSAVAFLRDEQGNEPLLACGSQSKSDLAPSAGKSYVFALNGSGEWIEQAAVLPDVMVEYGWFGRALAWATASQRTFVIVGAPGSDGHGVLGSVYAFRQDGQGNWNQAAHLQAPDGTSDNSFGLTLDAVEGNGQTLLAVGAPGQGYVGNRQPGTAYFYRFDPVNEQWTLEAQFEAPQPVDQDFFAYDVALGLVNDIPGVTHRAAVGRPHEGGGGAPTGSGAVYIYDRHEDGTWTLQAHLTPPVANPGPIRFGWALDIEEVGAHRLIVGAPVDSAFGSASGSGFVFERDGGTGAWNPVQVLFGHDTDGNDLFGSELILGNGASAGQAIVGAEQWNCRDRGDEFTVGAVYSFDLDPGSGGACPPPVLTLQKVPDCSSGLGGELEVRWFQATPDRSARVAILFGRRTGGFVIPNGNPCAGTPLGLGSLELQVAFTGSSGQFGAGRVKTSIPRAACGGYLQLLDVTRCATSNVVRIE